MPAAISLTVSQTFFRIPRFVSLWRTFSNSALRPACVCSGNACQQGSPVSACASFVRSFRKSTAHKDFALMLAECRRICISCVAHSGAAFLHSLYSCSDRSLIVLSVDVRVVISSSKAAGFAVSSRVCISTAVAINSDSKVF
eukprot:1195140-Prorocentrum_minimum.AAC.1